MDSSQHLHWTYRQLRMLAGASLIVVPVLIVIVGWARHQIILPTLSHYYFGESVPGLLRTLFTGFLILVGGLMLVYRGFDDKDNWIHNAAGVLAIAVALFPKALDAHDVFKGGVRYEFLHGASAVLLFFAAAFAVIYSGGARLQSRLVKAEISLLLRWRIAALIGMISGGIAYLPYVLSWNKQFLPPTGVLLVEMTGFFGFALYWLGMTHVIHNANLRISDRKEELHTERMPDKSDKDDPIP